MKKRTFLQLHRDAIIRHSVVMAISLVTLYLILLTSEQRETAPLFLYRASPLFVICLVAFTVALRTPKK